MTNLQALHNELLDEIKLFYPDFSACENLSITHEFITGQQNNIVTNHNDISSHSNNIAGHQNGIATNHNDISSHSDNIVRITINDSVYEYSYDADNYQKTASWLAGLNAQKRQVKFFNKLSIYMALSEYTGRQMAWGSLTGIRPTKLAYDMLKAGANPNDIPSLLTTHYLVSEEKSKIIQTIIQNQSRFLLATGRDILFYVHIPFCKSICSYCAFTAEPIARNLSLVREYSRVLADEIRHAKELVKSRGLRIAAVYVGGGTPTAIDDESFELILSALDFKNIEFTCEAGRPDTITANKLEIMQKYGVNRLCVNPQTLNDSTLRTIGRSHTLTDFLEAFNLAKLTNMDINVDLIAGLPAESFDDFARSLHGVMALGPQNITVHTLSIKNGAELKNASFNHQSYHEGENSISDMTSFAFSELTGAGYAPYYLYRQKHIAENLENIGYAKKDKQCKYNIASMEEMASVIACGAGGISKRLFEHGRIERLANLRDVRLYMQNAKDRLDRKASFFV